MSVRSEVISVVSLEVSPLLAVRCGQPPCRRGRFRGLIWCHGLVISRIPVVICND